MNIRTFKRARLAVAACVAVASGPIWCQVPPAKCATDVPQHLNWCSTNHGFNEGATCGLDALTGVKLDLPLRAGQPVLGNTWDRTNMMGATKAAYKLGAKNEAVAAAICCQSHDSDAMACLSSRKDLVRVWLDANSK